MKPAMKEISSAAPRVVRLFQPFGLCQLFRPLAKDNDERPTLNETMTYRDLSLRFSAREALGAPEQTLLLVLLEMAEEQYRIRPTETRLDQTDRSEVGTLLWSALHPGAAADPHQTAPPTLRLNCSWSELHRRCGSASVGGAVTRSRRQSLIRLCEVTVWERAESTGTERSGRLVSWLVGDNQRVHVALNHRLATALLAPGYAQVLLSERLQLPSQTAMLVHAFLSTCLGHGKSMSIGYLTLAERLWPTLGGQVPASTQRRRLSDVKAALRAIDRLGRWTVAQGAKTAHVSRSPLGRMAEASERRAACADASVTKPRAVREMTSPSHFAVPTASYVEQPFWKNAANDTHLP